MKEKKEQAGLLLFLYEKVYSLRTTPPKDIYITQFPSLSTMVNSNEDRATVLSYAVARKYLPGQTRPDSFTINQGEQIFFSRASLRSVAVEILNCCSAVGLTELDFRAGGYTWWKFWWVIIQQFIFLFFRLFDYNRAECDNRDKRSNDKHFSIVFFNPSNGCEISSYFIFARITRRQTYMYPAALQFLTCRSVLARKLLVYE